MKSKIKEAFFLICALGALGLIPIFLSKDAPIEVSVPALSRTEVEEKEAQEARTQQAAAAKAKVRRIFRCEMDEDCIIVDDDPCGCLVGPKGVTSINAAYSLDFSNSKGMIAKTCPDTEPSTERECSPSAYAACVDNVCKIRF